MQFVYAPLAWGFLLVAVPLLIHLINLLRHRRQRWAAMEFLMESYRKHRRWVWMKQLLLLLSRMAIMILLVALLANWVSSARWLSVFGQSITHYYILIDDSQSMAEITDVATSRVSSEVPSGNDVDRSKEEVTAGGSRILNSGSRDNSAYQAALRAVANLLRSVADDSGSHQVTLFRYSRTQLMNSKEQGDAENASSFADILSRTIPSNPDALLDRLRRTNPVGVDLSPISSIKTINQLIAANPGEQARVYIVSDYREKDWKQISDIKAALEPIGRSSVPIELIDCSPANSPNLSIVNITPDEEILATSVPVMMRIAVKNQGPVVVRNVQLAVRQYEVDPQTNEPRGDRFASGGETLLPPAIIDQIAPGETAVTRTQVIFNKAGSQVVNAQLPDDALLADNLSSATLEIQEGQELLIVEGDDSRRSSFYLEATLNPGGLTRTGWKTRTEGIQYLRDTEASGLSKYASIVVIGGASIDEIGIKNLETYVNDGGGLAIFYNTQFVPADIAKWNRLWHRNGDGLAPMQIKELSVLSRTSGDALTPDVLPAQHPIFAPLLGLSSSPLQFVRVGKYLKLESSRGAASSFAERQPQESVTDNSSIEASGDARTFGRLSAQPVALLRNNSPLMIDRNFGKGHVVQFAVGLDPTWTTWPQDPTFVVTILKTFGYLASFRSVDFSERVGRPIEWKYSSRDYLPEWQCFLGERGKEPAKKRLQINGEEIADGIALLKIDAKHAYSDEAELNESLFETLYSPGLTEIWGTTLQGTNVVKRFSRNVVAAEGELKKIASNDLLVGLQGLPVRYRTAESVVAQSVVAGLSNRQGLILTLLIILLMIEQYLGWSASFHLPQFKAAA